MIRTETADPKPNGIAARALATMSGAGGLAKYDAACRAIAEAAAVDEVKDIRDTARQMAAAARIAQNKQAEADMMAIRFRAERRLGELMAAQRDNGMMADGAKGIGTSAGYEKTRTLDAPITLSEAGIDKNLADRARKYAAIPEKEFQERIDDYRIRVAEEGERAMADLVAAGEKHVRGTFGTGENEWYTPDEHLEVARKVLGGFDLDPASSHVANRRVKASQFFSQETDGLSRPWFGKVWLNPPYAQPAIAQFADKIVAEWENGNVEAAIVLTHNYTDTAWFQKLANAASAICFTRGRVRFVSPSGELAAPTQGQAFTYFGHDVDGFAVAFSEIGFVAEVRAP
jgi:phage N-6-adenine-methyltransferase